MSAGLGRHTSLAVDATIDAVTGASVDVVSSASPATVHERRVELGTSVTRIRRSARRPRSRQIERLASARTREHGDRDEPPQLGRARAAHRLRGGSVDTRRGDRMR